jgi:hypothetical protein
MSDREDSMTAILNSLHRLRQHARRESELALKRAETERDAQRERLDGVRAEIERARESLDPSDPVALAAYHQFRLREEMLERRETARLQQREREVASNVLMHQKNVRDELSLQNVLDEHAQRTLEEDRRAETRDLDELGQRLRRDG